MGLAFISVEVGALFPGDCQSHCPHMVKSPMVDADCLVCLVWQHVSPWHGVISSQCNAALRQHNLDQLVEVQRKMGTVHFHLVATQGGDERRVRERRGQHERGL